MIKQIKWSEMVCAMLLCVAGVVLVMMPGLALDTIATLIGTMILVIGIIFVASYFATHAPGSPKLVIGIVFAAIGLFCILDTSFIVSILPVAFGIGIILSGAFKIQRGFDLLKMGHKFAGMIISAAISLVFGVVIILYAKEAAEFLVRIIGAALIYSGVTDFISVLYVSKKASDYIKGKDSVKDEKVEIIDETDKVETVEGDVLDKNGKSIN